MSYGQGRNRAFTIFMFGEVRLRLGHITYSKKNLILKPLVVSSLVIALDQGVQDFIVHLIPPGSLSQTGLYTLKMKLKLIPILFLMRYLLEKSMLKFFFLYLMFQMWMFLLSNSQPLIKESMVIKWNMAFPLIILLLMGFL